MNISVITSEGECERFRAHEITKKLVKTGLEPVYAREVTNKVTEKIKKIEKAGVESIYTSQIWDMANGVLLDDKKLVEEIEHSRVGIGFDELAQLIKEPNFDNANMIRNSESFHKWVADNVLKKYSLMKLPKHLRDAHVFGLLHIHDLEYFPARPANCLQHFYPFFGQFGLKVDGSGEHTSVASPPKRLETVMNHAGEIMLASQQNMSGGQAMSMWNVFVAPYAAGLTYKEIKQCVQMFIFNLNMAYANRGGQVPFTSISLEFTVPKFIQDEPAVGPGGKITGVYGDYEKETRLLQRAFTETLLEGDGAGKPHLFPNTAYVLRDEVLRNSELDEDLLKVHMLSAKFSSSYFINMLTSYRGNMANYMGCRTALNDNWTGDWKQDCFQTGNLAYVTINLPRIAYRSNTAEDIYTHLHQTLLKATEILLLRRGHAEKCLNQYQLMPFLAQKDGDGMYYRIENATLSFGIAGLDEYARLVTGGGLDTTDGLKVAHNIVDEINNYAKELVKDTGYRWTVLQTPGETTCHRFAEIDHRRYPERAISKGEAGSRYYTNSSHVPVDDPMLLSSRIKIEEGFHRKTLGGHIFHAFLGEAAPDPSSLMSLTKKIARNSDIGFWAYSSAFSYCFGCATQMRGLQEQCVTCGNPDKVEWYDRVTGYVQQVGHKKNSLGGWNAGKRKELEDRYRNEVIPGKRI